MAGEQMRRYRFGPLERRGIVAGLRTGQAVIVAASLVGVVVVLQLSTSPGVAFAALRPSAPHQQPHPRPQPRRALTLRSRPSRRPVPKAPRRR